MKCEKGDLAVLKTGGIPGGTPFNGRFVDVVRFGYDDPYFGPMWYVRPLGWAPGPELVRLTPEGEFLYPDCLMHPIRDQPGQDEILRLAGQPNETVHEFTDELSLGKERQREFCR